MDSRNIKTSSNHFIFSVELESLTCPITQELFFEPVLAMPCGHCFEKRASASLKKSACPICRQKIIMFGQALDKKTMLDKVLTEQPELYAQVYFNHDHFSEIIEKNKLKTITGQRFIKVLQHAVNHLTEKAITGKQKNKTAIDILLSSEEGPLLLAYDEKIKQLVASQKKPTTSTSGFFASSNATCKAHAAELQSGDTIWQRVVYGNEIGVLQMLSDNPHLMKQKANVIDYSGRIVDHATPFQMALRAGDDVMADKIKALYIVLDPENGQEVLDTQFKEIFPRGIAQHLKEQKQSANNFEQDYLNPLVDAIIKAPHDDILAALGKYNNDSVLCTELNRFKTGFTEISLREKIYNPWHLVKAFEKYCDVDRARWLSGGYEPTHRLKQLLLFWRQVIGWEERYMTTNYVQSVCTGFCNIVKHHKPLQREMNLDINETNQCIKFFPLDINYAFRLGSEFAVFILHNEAGVTTRSGDSGETFIRLISYKNSALEKLMLTTSKQAPSFWQDMR